MTQTTIDVKHKEREMIVHEYKIRKDNEYYMVIFVGNQKKGEEYFFNTWKVKEMYYIKSYVWDKATVFKMALRNRTFDGGALLRLDYLHQWYGTCDKDAPKAKDAHNLGKDFYSKPYQYKDNKTHIEEDYILSDETLGTNNDELELEKEENYE